jgi:plastocyanin
MIVAPVLLALALTFGSVAAPSAAEEGGRHVHDAIAGFTFLAGSASLNTPGQPFHVRTGDTVFWTNLDPVSHDVAFDSIDFAAYLKSPGNTAQFTFSTPGYFTYRCNQHPEFPGMQGLVFVSDDAP